MALGVKVERDLTIGAAGGMIIQMLPDAQEGAVDALEKMIGAMPPLTTLISGLSGAFDPEIDRLAEAASADDSGQTAGETLQADDSGQPAGKTLQADAENQEASERLAALLQEIFKDVPEEYQPEILAEREIRWECDCSRERIEQCAFDHWPQRSDGDHRGRRRGGAAVSVLSVRNIISTRMNW